MQKTPDDISTQRTRNNSTPLSLVAPVSPPLAKVRLARKIGRQAQSEVLSSVKQAAVEADRVKIRDHLAYFSQRLKSYELPLSSSNPRLSLSTFQHLFRRSQHPNGRHFVIHQHDHPVAGTHYDLRLQINETSSVSWAIMHGLPGNPASRRGNRNATETRIHCLWNHLVETASHATGSVLIWDTGEYEILPYHQREAETGDECSSATDENNPDTRAPSRQSEPQKLYEAFQMRKIRLRLHGARLPKCYTVSLRLASFKQRGVQPKKPARKRRKRNLPKVVSTPISDSEEEDTATKDVVGSDAGGGRHSDIEDDTEQVRLNNAYPGSTNTIGSVHQRTWYLSLDKSSSGFVKQHSDGSTHWIRGKGEGMERTGFKPFFVRGKEAERSIVTGRLAADILRDEGVEDYTGRAGWRAILE